ncbi:MAG: SGNH/GDSL hydrolase family protein [Lachnospiraceae bacterium]|nr:SGNH/GDSL hydrolase family protein [Lachnospiraceae bacterium]
MRRRRREEQKAWRLRSLRMVPVVIAAFFLIEALGEDKSYVMAQQNDYNQEEELQTGDTASTAVAGYRRENAGRKSQRLRMRPYYKVPENSQTLYDMDGNVVWQADTISPETVELLQAYVQERSQVYEWENSFEKTLKINELDKKILETAGCTFPNVKINFIGDSITEGFGGSQDADGRQISYVNYVQEALQFGEVCNHGRGSATIAPYSDNDERAIGAHEDEFFGSEYEIAVFYAGVNDFLAGPEVKDFGVLDNGTTEGYCGELQRIVNVMKTKCPNTLFFFVTAYPTFAQASLHVKYINFEGIPTLDDYMNPIRIVAQRNGYPVIDIYNTGLMDTHDADTAENFLSDWIHPNDTGYRILGDHIAAEILLYCLGITE